MHELRGQQREQLASGVDSTFGYRAVGWTGGRPVPYTDRIMRPARLTLAILLSALAVFACDKGDPVAPVGAKLTVTANPMQIGVNGTATVVATVLRSSNAPVNPGTEVHFFTTLGTVSPEV